MPANTMRYYGLGVPFLGDNNPCEVRLWGLRPSVVTMGSLAKTRLSPDRLLGGKVNIELCLPLIP